MSTEELSNADWDRINARGAASVARQREAQTKLLKTLQDAPGGEYRAVFRGGELVGYAPVVEPPLGELTPSGFRNGTHG